MSASLKAIAEALHLSKATVSWILAGRGEEKGFSPHTIRLVQEYARKVQYRPNLLARGLIKGCTHTIGLILPAIDDTFFSQLAQAVETQAYKNGYQLIVSSSEGTGSKEKQLTQTLRAHQVDGLIIAPTMGVQSSVTDMLEEHYPFVFIDRYYPGLDTNYVIVNNEKSSTLLVAELIGRGCRKIAAMTTDMHLQIMKERIDGYRTALTDASLPYDADLISEVRRDNYRVDIPGKLASLLQEHPDIDGFFFTTHYIALEAIRYFIGCRIDYDRRFRMGCFHRSGALEILSPRMAFSVMPVEEMGRQAVDILLRDLGQRDSFPFEQVVLTNRTE